MRGAENMQVRSMRHVVQFVASPAAFGFRDRVNCLRDPTEEMVDGR
jgi:hypothetical protein